MPEIEPQSHAVTLLSQNAFSARDVKQGRNRHVHESDGGMRPFLRVFEHLSARCGPCGQGTVATVSADGGTRQRLLGVATWA
eukprot:5901068-Prymnesium_polylepis.1